MAENTTTTLDPATFAVAYPRTGCKVPAWRVTISTGERIATDPAHAEALIVTAMGNGYDVTLEHGMLFTRSDSARIFFPKVAS